MTDGNDTGNRVRSPFEELPIEIRARSGDLVGKELTIIEVAKLQFPNDLAGELAWRLRLIDEFPESIRWRKYTGVRLSIGGGNKQYYRVPPDLYAAFLRETQTPATELIALWLGWTPPHTVEPLPQGEPDRPESGAAATRKIALVEAEDVALATLRKKLKREPDFEEFWRYITERDDTGTISDYTDDRLIWTGKDGRNCKTAKSTMRNRLTAARKRAPFT